MDGRVGMGGTDVVGKVVVGRKEGRVGVSNS